MTIGKCSGALWQELYAHMVTEGRRKIGDVTDAEWKHYVATVEEIIRFLRRPPAPRDRPHHRKQRRRR